MLRHFSFQSIHGRDGATFGYEAQNLAGKDGFSGDVDAASLVMIDNWLLYDFEELASGQPVLLNCARESLMSGFITLLPQSAVIELHKSALPDPAVLSACRRLKAQGYRIALDDFQCTDGIEPFLEIADYIKVDFQLLKGQERLNLLASLRETGAKLIGEKIETPEELAEAWDEGCDLVQGYQLGKLLTFAKDRDRVHPLRCLGILDKLVGPDCTPDEIAYWVALDSGLEARILHTAKSISGAPDSISMHDALELIGKSGVRKLLLLAMSATLEHRLQTAPILAKSA